jgi:hypothetical protein
MLERFTLATFAEHLNDSFRLSPEEGTDLELVLIEATDLSTEAQRSASSPGRRAPFSIVFRGPRTPILPQRIYRLGHYAIGDFDLFLVPIGPDAQGVRYEAIFT